MSVLAKLAFAPVILGVGVKVVTCSHLVKCEQQFQIWRNKYINNKYIEIVLTDMKNVGNFYTWVGE